MCSRPQCRTALRHYVMTVLILPLFLRLPLFPFNFLSFVFPTLSMSDIPTEPRYFSCILATDSARPYLRLVAVPSFSLCSSLRWARPQVKDSLVELPRSVRLAVSVHSPPRLVRFNLVSVLLPT